MNDNYEPDLMTLTDEDGAEHEFEVLDNLELEDNRYLALLPLNENPEEAMNEDGELVIMKVAEDEDGEYLEIIEDEEEFNTVCAIFMERLEDYYDIEEVDEE